MGLFAYFRKMFNKNIENDEEYDGEFVHMYSKDQATFHIGYNIVVRPGFNAVFVVRDRVTDVLPSGKYRIGLESLPLTFHKLKLDRIKKNGEQNATKFRADLYYVNVSPFKDFKFSGDAPFVNKTKEFGKVSAYTEGTCTVQVQDAGDLVAYLLIDLPYVVNKKALSITGTLVGNLCNKVLEKSHMTIKDIFKSPDSAGQFVNENIGQYLKDFGISVSDVSFKYLDISSRVQKKISGSIDEEKSFADEYNKIGADGEDVESMEPKFIVENHVDDLTGDMAQSSVENVQPEPQNEQVAIDNVEDYVQKNNSQNTVENDNDSAQVSGIITCPNCGEHLASTAHFCSNCGFDLTSLK